MVRRMRVGVVLGCPLALLLACEPSSDPAPAAPQLVVVDVEDDDSVDGALQPGESARLAVTVRNDGEEPILGAAIHLTTTSVMLRIEDAAPVPCGHIQPGTEVACGGPAQWTRVTLDAAAEPGSSVPVAILLTDEGGDSWPLVSQVPVTAAPRR